YYQEKKLLEQYVDADVSRLKFVNAQVSDMDKKETFLARLKEIEEEFKNVTTSTLASFEMAKQYQSDHEYVMAVQVCQKAIERHSKSDGGILCQDLVDTIKHPQFSVKTENSINKSNATLTVKYKNIRKLYFRIIQDDWKNYLDNKWRRLDDDLEHKVVTDLLRKKPLQEWTLDLAETEDFNEREVGEAIPNLPYGFYRIFASSDQQFSPNNTNSQQQLVYTSFWQTDTLILLRGQDKTISGLILDARTGTPLEKRTISIYKRNNNKEGIHEKIGDVQSNKNGLWEYRLDQNNSDWSMYYHVASKDTGDTVYSQWINVNYLQEKIFDTHVLFFTDRAIYRPGQRIHFKGICYNFDQKSDEYNVSKCSDVQISLHDNNGKEISKVFKDSNDFGSFSGDFLAPKNTLMGVMNIRASQYSGITTIHIEEYKRPKFEVTMVAPDKQYRLDDTITVSGKAMSYAGAPLGSAKVKFRVLRGVRLPWWWYWANPYSAEQEIVHGQIKTNDDGEFSIEFKARPNKAVNPKFKPFFSYRTEVDVVDSTGETRSGNVSINVGYVAMQMRPTVEGWLPDNQDIKLHVSTTTLDGRPAQADGTVEIHALNAPKNVQRRPSSGEYYNWYWYWASDTHASNSTKDLSNIENWEIRKSVTSAKFTSKEGAGDVSFKLDEGAYCAILRSKDQFGSAIEERLFFTVFGLSTQKNTFSINVPSFFRAQSTSLKVGEKLQAIHATGYQHGGTYI
ncbi:MAG: MG2 domain-containing protein, partial [Bdellovibrionota bacterium]